MAQTRIIKYGELREQVQQEIKILSLKTIKPAIPLENIGKINKIDANIVLTANQLKNEIFPELIPLISNQNKEKNALINQEIQTLGQNLVNVTKMTQNQREFDDNVANFVARLTNEAFLLQKQQNLTHEKKRLAQFFSENIAQIKKEHQQEQQNFDTVDKNQLIREILANNKQLTKQIERIKKNAQQKKQKTFWIFLLSLTLMVASITCLIFYFVIQI